MTASILCSYQITLKIKNMALQSRKKETSGSRNQTIKINPYENYENVMKLMANICAAGDIESDNAFEKAYKEALNKEINGISLLDFVEEKKESFANKDFIHDLIRYCRILNVELESHENTSHTQIVVAGGFSSGKSSFLNKLTNRPKLLPTGVEPVSAVKTYLYCSRNKKEIQVKGVNQKNALIALDKDILQAIQHSNKSNTYLLAVLDKLFVEVPSEKLDGLAFIDTPGYNNSDMANQYSGKTDKETALEAMSEGNVLFWLVDCERGTIVADDIEIVKQFDGPKLFIFNKADKKRNDVKMIVDDAAKTIRKFFSDDEVIDIIAYSTLDDKVYYSNKSGQRTIEQILQQVRQVGGSGYSEIENLKGTMASLFNQEIAESEKLINRLKSSYKEKVALKDEIQEDFHNVKETRDSLLADVRKCMIDSYNEIMKAADERTLIMISYKTNFKKFWNAVYDDYADRWRDGGLKAALDNADDALSRIDKMWDSPKIRYTYFTEEDRNSIIQGIETLTESYVDKYQELYDDVCEQCDSIKNNLDNEHKFLEAIKKYREVFFNAILAGIRAYMNDVTAEEVSYDDNEENETDKMSEIFKFIEESNFSMFRHCFEGTGIDMSVCNPDGYNPLTYAAKVGNYSMVKFMLDNGADPQAYDRNGYNALHTAVENQYRTICELLVDECPDLIDTETSKGETISDLANKHTFSKWLTKEIL